MARVKRMSTSEIFDPWIVELWGVDYELRQGTRSTEEDSAALQEKLNDLLKDRVEEVRNQEDIPADVPDDEVELPYDKKFNQKRLEILAAMLDAILEPVPSEGDEGKAEKAPRAKAHLLALYKANEISLAAADSLVVLMNEKINERRPT